MTIEGYVKLVERKESPLFVSLIIRGFNKYFNSAMDVDYSVRNYRYDDGVHYLSKEDAAALKGALEECATSGTKYWQWYVNRCHEVGDELIETGRMLGAKIVDRDNLPDLRKGFHLFCEASKKMTPFLASTVLLQKILEQQLKEELQQHPSVAQQIVSADAVMSELQSSAAPTEAVLEMRNCHKLARIVSADPIIGSILMSEDTQAFLSRLRDARPDILSQLSEHVERYGWLRTHGYRFDPLSVEDLVERVRTLIRLGRIPPEEKHSSRIDLRLLLKCEPRTGLLELVDVLRDLIALRFYRIDVHLRADTLARPFMRRIAESLNMTRDQLVFCTEEEIVSAFSGGCLPSNDEISRRELNWFTQVLTGERLEMVCNPTPRKLGAPSSGVRLKGMTASRGRVQAPVKIMLGAEEMDKLSDGDILVTSMTTPDFMSAIERCGGIITDEGGILCHAAIISREIGLPCIIGTQEATRLLRDGMIVELDATQVEGLAIAIQ